LALTESTKAFYRGDYSRASELAESICERTQRMCQFVDSGAGGACEGKFQQRLRISNSLGI